MDKQRVIWVSAICLIACIVSFGMVVPASAQLRIGIGGGAYLPTGDAEESFDISPEIHGTVLFGIKDTIEIEGGLEYWILQDSLDAEEFSASYAILTGGVRLHPSSAIHLDAGLGLYRSNFEWETEEVDVDESEAKPGVYGGLGIELGAFDIKARAHAPDFDDFYIGASLTFLFDLSNLFER
jgi:hypothetical protein